MHPCPQVSVPMYSNQIGRMLLCVLQVSHSGTVLDAHSLTATLLSPLAPVEGKIYVTA